ncbi:protein kinase domain-containing protein [Fischerella sp. PCC 9605]|uniref:protein kinase domain-containing protein n=1 Tax=Fischerella sp. PCC 9605 TaxID=1173024 RepID=UPI000687EB8A|nr:macro domain-containing protein [Fischerella sp. PCC 9605]
MLGTIRGGRYRIKQLLSRSGFDQTYLAEDINLPGNPRCVVKQLMPLSTDVNTLQVVRRLFVSEAELLVRLGNHDQIPKILAYFEENQELFLVQEFIDGHDLSKEIIPGKQLSETYVITLLQDILQLLKFVHENNIIHRDIKPSNLVRRRSDKKIIIIDFLASKELIIRTKRTEFQKQEEYSTSTIAIGTPGYMPPEQAKGHPVLCSDIYAVGIIGIQALTGIQPLAFQEDINTGEIVWHNQAQVSKKLANILDKMVQPDYRKRYQSVDEVLKALHSLGTPTTYIPKGDNISENPVQYIGRWVQRFFAQKQENSNEAKEIAETAKLPPVKQPTLSPETILQTPEKILEIVQIYIQEEHFDRALATAQQIPDEQKHLEALTKVVQAVSKLESNRVLELLAPLQNDPNERVRQLVRELQFTSFPQPEAISSDEALARIEFVQGDLLALDVDALVNPTGLDVSNGGAISLQLFERLGSQLYETLQNQPLLRSGEVFVTDAGSLPAHYIIHTPTEEREGRHTTASIVRGVSAALAKADSLSDVRTIAFPSVGTGAAGFDPADLAPKVLRAVTNHLKQGSQLEKVIFTFIEEFAYQVYVSVYQTLLSETSLAYDISLTISKEATGVGGEIEVSIYLMQIGADNQNDYLLRVPQTQAVGSELNIILTAPGFQFDSDNTASLPLDPDTAQETQTARFRLTALRPGNATITTELYQGDTFETKLETNIEVSGFDETSFTKNRITTQPRPVPQPDFILRVQPVWNETNSDGIFNYQLRSFRFPTVFSGETNYQTVSFSNSWLEQMRGMLANILKNISEATREDGKSSLVSLGQYLFQHFFPTELQSDFRNLIPQNYTFTLLILADQEAWIPWELLHDSQRFLGDRFIIGRWLQELNDTRPYEFPVGAVNVAHYANVEQPQLWTTLLETPGAPPPQPLPAGVLHDSTEAIRGLHLIRYSQSADTVNRRNAPVTLDNANDTEDIEHQIRPAKLNLRRNRPLVTLGYVKTEAPELTTLEQTWASAFIRAGCSGFIGSLWAVEPAVEAAFISNFYNRLWTGASLGEAFSTSRQLARAAAPDSLDYLAYVLFGDPMARPYRPVEGKGYAVVEPIGRDIDEPLPSGVPVRFRLTLRRTPPVWHEERVIEVAENLTFENLQVHVKTIGLQVTPDSPIAMSLAPTGNYLGWFTLVAPPEMAGNSALVQVYFMDGVLPIHSLMFSLNIAEGGETA